ncbi:hypothetical protein BCR42DRAFT_419484 [Absidia repens]|uniref:Uncharacterized protein n=1 Tax=Absidia repens TaxID=90262 RepID=A0A1X2IBC9_9FUNG|nr:hypothetical protein BCR42DRAFT_419484 [Absidia repens]
MSITSFPPLPPLFIIMKVPRFVAIHFCHSLSPLFSYCICLNIYIYIYVCLYESD